MKKKKIKSIDLPKRYFIKNRLINRPYVLYKVNENFVGKTEEDYYKGLMIELTESQAAFYLENPNARFHEIMKEAMDEVVEEEIKEL